VELPGEGIMDRSYSIILADDHIEFRREMRKVMEEIPGIAVTGEAGNRGELFALLEESPPEMVILDISMPDLRAWEGTQLIKLQYPDIQVLIMTMDQEKEYLCQGLAVGAAGVLPKQHVAGLISRAIAAVREGKFFLPPQPLKKRGSRSPALTAAS
jgi:DNA-binding NarL/FixJ family response regulator